MLCITYSISNQEEDMKPIHKRLLMACLAICVVMIAEPNAPAKNAPVKNGPLNIEYVIKVADIPAQLFHVTMNINDINEPYLYLSLPTWMPGLFKTEYYGKNIVRFKVTDEQGKEIGFRAAGLQRWGVNTKGRSRIKVEFDYSATTLAMNQAKITNDFAFFTGVQFYLMPEEHRGDPSTVRFEMPDGWKVISALKETDNPNVFRAADYDTLVDSPTQMGKFDVTKFDVAGKPHYVVTTPPGFWGEQRTQKFIQAMSKIVPAQSAMFGGLPYDKYIFFYFFMSQEWDKDPFFAFNNSVVTFIDPKSADRIQMLQYLAAHTLFHVWNLKRIRPAEHVPLDYSRMTVTPLWWMTEGFTTYYSEMSILRAGQHSKEEFLHGLEEMITSVKFNDARPYFSPVNASMQAWVSYEVSRPFIASASIQGRVLATLLDLSIRHDTDSASSLDDVMRALYSDFYLKGKGVSNEDLIAVINRLTKRDYKDFFERYVWGTEVPTHDQYLGYAGYRYEQYAEKIPFLGMRPTQTPEGPKVTELAPNSPATEAGVKVGDVLLTIDEMQIKAGLAGLRDWLTPQIGKTINLTLKRGNEQLTLPIKVAGQDQQRFRISDVASPTPAQLKLRQEWLKVSARVEP
jgi:predicted metalloprotease with PDZ domain